MPIGHGKRSNDVKKSVFFLYENLQIYREFYPNNSTFYYTITKEGNERVRKMLYDSHTRNELAIYGIIPAFLDDYKNGLTNRLSPQQQVSIEAVIKL
jgi:hypothetical protein